MHSNPQKQIFSLLSAALLTEVHVHGYVREKWHQFFVPQLDPALKPSDVTEVKDRQFGKDHVNHSQVLGGILQLSVNEVVPDIAGLRMQYRMDN